MIRCKCGETDPAKFSLKRGKQQNWCRECNKAYQREWYRQNRQEHIARVAERNAREREKNKEKFLTYLLMHPCAVCGEADPVVLDFHHVGPKKFSVSQAWIAGYAWEMIAAEIEQCIVLCANCHRREHARLDGWYRMGS